MRVMLRTGLPILLLVAMTSGLAGAGGEAAGRRAAQGGPPVGGRRANPPAGPNAEGTESVPASELVTMLDTYAIVQAQNALNLTDAQYGSFVTRLKRLQETRRRSQRARNQILQELRKLTNPRAETPVDEPTLRDRLRALREVDDQAALDMRKAYDALDEGLDLRQQARFRVLEETIERRKLDLLVRARERAARRGGL